MSLETVAHINDLVPANPLGTDDRRTADDHIRNIKLALKTDLPLDAPASTVGMNVLKGATSDAIRSLLGASNNPFRNRVINGDMSIDQRSNGVSKTITAGAALAYVVDRFYAYCSGSNITAQQFRPTAGHGLIKLTGSASNIGAGLGTRLQAVNTFDLINKNATLSCFLQCSTGTLNVTWAVYYATFLDGFGTIAAPARTSISSGTFIASTTDTQFSTTVSIPSAAYTGIEIVFSVAALPSDQDLNIGNVQFERGSIQASDIVFEVVDIPLQQARCNFYYKKFSGSGGLAVLGSGHQNSTTASRIAIPISDMRVKPAVSFVGSVLLDIAGATTEATLSTQYKSVNSLAFDVTHAAIGAAGGAAMLQLPFGNNSIEIDAEMYT